MHETNVYRTILGGVSRGFRTPLVDFSARSLIFRHLKMGTFGESAHFQVPKMNMVILVNIVNLPILVLLVNFTVLVILVYLMILLILAILMNL